MVAARAAVAVAKCEEVIRVGVGGGEYGSGKGSLFEKKKKNDKKEKGMKKRLRKGDQKKKKGQNGGNFPT